MFPQGLLVPRPDVSSLSRNFRGRGTQSDGKKDVESTRERGVWGRETLLSTTINPEGWVFRAQDSVPSYRGSESTPRRVRVCARMYARVGVYVRVGPRTPSLPPPSTLRSVPGSLHPPEWNRTNSRSRRSSYSKKAFLLWAALNFRYSRPLLPFSVPLGPSRPVHRGPTPTPDARVERTASASPRASQPSCRRPPRAARRGGPRTTRGTGRGTTVRASAGHGRRRPCRPGSWYPCPSDDGTGP